MRGRASTDLPLNFFQSRCVAAFAAGIHKIFPNPDELRNELKFDANDVQQVLDEREKLPREITVTLDELSLDCLDDVNKVEEAISNYLLDTYGYYSDSHEWECGDDVDTIDVYNIEWDTTKK